jgi:YVTN family beta-propeller protein
MPSNTANLTEIAIDDLVVAKAETAGAPLAFTFNGFGSSECLGAVQSGNYPVSAISTNAANLAGICTAPKPYGRIAYSEIKVTAATPEMTLGQVKATAKSGITTRIFYGVHTFNNQLTSSLYVDNILVSNTAAGLIDYVIPGMNITPTDIAFAPSGAYAYVTNTGADTVSILNTSTDIDIGTITGFDFPYGVAFAPSGAYAYVTNSGGQAGLSVINTSSSTVIGTIPLSTYPLGVAFSPSGAYAYVTNNGNNTVGIINTSTRRITGIIPGFGGPDGVAFAPSGAYAYVVNINNNSVDVVNTTTETITQTIFGGFENPLLVAFSPDGTYAYVANPDKYEVSIINTSTDSVFGAISRFDEPSGVAVSPSGSYLYVVNQANNTISVVNTGIGYYNLVQGGLYMLTVKTLGDANYTPIAATASFCVGQCNMTSTIIYNYTSTIQGENTTAQQAQQSGLGGLITDVINWIKNLLGSIGL